MWPFDVMFPFITEIVTELITELKTSPVLGIFFLSVALFALLAVCLALFTLGFVVHLVPLVLIPPFIAEAALLVTTYISSTTPLAANASLQDPIRQAWIFLPLLMTSILAMVLGCLG
jgi:hypothetical protein